MGKGSQARAVVPRELIYRRLFFLLFALVCTFLLGSSPASAAVPTTTQVTDNSYYDWYPQISGNNVVWWGSDGSDDEIFFYDGSTITAVTDNSDQDILPQVSGDNVVWQGHDGSDYEIFLNDGSSTAQLTDNTINDTAPQVSGGNVVWESYDGTDTDIFLYNGSTVTTLTDNDYDDNYPQISGDKVVWQGFDGTDEEIFLYDGSSVNQLTYNSREDGTPQISGNNVVWWGTDGLLNAQIFLYDGTSTSQLTANLYHDMYPQISGDNIVWKGQVGGIGSDEEIFFYDGENVTQLTNNSREDKEPQISGDNVVWRGGGPSSANEIFVYDGSKVTTLTDNGYNDQSPQISGDNVVWQGAVGDWEIFQAEAFPPITTLSTSPTTPNVGDWFTTTTTVNLTRDEPGTTYYQIDSTDSAGWTVGDSTTAPEGIHTFYYYSVDTAGNTETVQNQTIKVDTQDPIDPNITSPSHTAGAWSSDQTVDIDLSDATDTASAVEGFSISWSQDATEVPAQTLNASATLSSTISPVLGGGTWYVNVSTKDYVGNWTSPAHLGPLKIDVTNPTAPTLSGLAVGASQIDVSWTGASDLESGLDGYKIYNADTDVELADTSLTSHSFTGLSDDTTYGYYARSYDNADNTSTPSNTVEILAEAGNTLPGPGVATVTVSPIPGIDIEFGDIISGGDTTVTTSTTPVAGPPSGFKFRGHQLNISTDASYTPPIIISIQYNEADVPGNESSLKLFHYENGQWENVTISLDTVNNIITGSVNSLSPFILGGPLPPTGINSNALFALALALLASGYAIRWQRQRFLSSHP